MSSAGLSLLDKVVLSRLDTGLDDEIRRAVEERIGVLIGDAWEELGRDTKIDTVFMFLPEAAADEARQLWAWLTETQP